MQPVRHLACALLLTLALPAWAGNGSDDTYQVSTAAAVLGVGGKGQASVTIAARKGWHLNPEAPLTLKLAVTPGLTVDKPKQGRSDLALSTPSQARFEVGITASEPGHKEIEAEASFVLCEENACRPIKEHVTLRVDVKPAR
ncbi:MAG: hypothetical protein ABSB49_05690 [Polyangia bacterium]|jgi:hypothetical protein